MSISVNNHKVIQCNIRDNTERKKAEELLQETEERFKSFFENSMDGLLFTRPDGKIISANWAACELFRLILKMN
ncbi:MAG: PAS domain-containing protein [Melioribacteraceae bacterium]|nr:PAS domain-containing protein [Melioribacteraceae bacterium]